MSASDGKDSKKEKRSTLDERLKELAEETAVIEHEIATVSKNLDEESEEFKEFNEKLYQKLKEELQKLNVVIENYKKQATEITDEINKRAEQFELWAEGLYDEVKKRLYIVFIVAVAILIVGYFFTFGFSFNISSLSTVVTAISLLVLIAITLSKMHDDIKEDYRAIKWHTQKAVSEVTKFVTHKFGISVDSAANKKLSSILSNTKKLGTAVRSFVPGVKEFYEGDSRLNRQQVFARSFHNALENFGISSDSQVEKYLFDKFSSWSDDEINWIKEASAKLSEQLKVPAEILSLAYNEYTNNIEGKANDWKVIKENEKLLKILAKILCQQRVVQIEYFNVQENSSSEAIEELLSKMNVFSLEIFRNFYYQFYVALARFKRELLAALANYGLKVSSPIETQIIKFVPTHTRWNGWISELLEETSELVSLDVNILELLFWDKLGDNQKRKTAWEQLEEKKRIVLFRLLIDNKLLQIPDRYINSPELVTFVVNVLKIHNDYNLLRFTTTLSKEFTNLDIFKKQILQTIANYSYYLSEENRETFEALLPKNSDTNEIIETFLEEKTHVDKTILHLLYLDYINDKIQRKLLFKDIKETELLAKIVSLLLEQEIIEIDEGDKNAHSHLSILLDALNDFRISDLQSLYRKCSTLMNYSELATIFLFGERMISNKYFVDFKTLHAITSKNEVDTTYGQLKLLVNHIITYEESNMWDSNPETLRGVTVAATTLFLYRREDINARVACQEASQIEVASRILYQRMRLTSEKGIEKTPCLGEVAKDVLEGKTEDYKLLTEFQSQLSNGLLYNNYHDLLSARIEVIQEQYKSEAESLRKNLGKMQQSVKDFLEVELRDESVILLLNSRLISAYMITTRSPKKVLSRIIDGALVKLCKKKAKSNPRYKQFLLFEEKKRSGGGRYTRVGVVPPNWSFEDYSDEFQKLFTEATKEYVNKNDPLADPKDYSIHLIRIFPSDVAFKLVEGGLETIGTTISKAHPVHIIKSLMVEKLGLIDNLEFVASLRVDEPRKVAMKGVIKSIIDTWTSIYLLTQQTVGSLISRHPKLHENMKNKNFDLELLSKSNCNYLSELAMNLSDSYRRAQNDEKPLIKKEFKRRIEELISLYQSRLGEEELNLLSSTIFTRLEEFGTILSM